MRLGPQHSTFRLLAIFHFFNNVQIGNGIRNVSQLTGECQNIERFWVHVETKRKSTLSKQTRKFPIDSKFCVKYTEYMIFFFSGKSNHIILLLVDLVS